jgi:hypothetical protein
MSMYRYLARITPWITLLICLTGLNLGLHWGLAPREGPLTPLPYSAAIGNPAPPKWQEISRGLWLSEVHLGRQRSYRLVLSGDAAPQSSYEVIFMAQAISPLARAHYVRVEGQRLSSGFYDAQGQIRSLVEHPLERPLPLEVGLEAKRYIIGVGGVEVASLPLRYQGGRILLRLEGRPALRQLQVLEGAGQLQPKAPANPAPGRVLYAENFASAQRRFVLLGGSWRAGQGFLEQTEAQGFDRVALAPIGPQRFYRLRVRLQHLEGAGGGVVFNLPNPRRLAQGHLVRYAEDGRSVFWGYFNDQGTFVGQGFAKVEPPGAAPHLLEVFSYDKTYEVWLDGAQLARDVPLVSNAGHLGLTTSLSRVMFTELRLEAAGPAPHTPRLPFGPLILHAIEGTWMPQGQALYQRSSQPTLARAISAQPLRPRRLRVELRWASPQAGAGIFIVPHLGLEQGGWGIRLSQGGRQATWGRRLEGERLDGGSVTLEPGNQVVAIELAENQARVWLNNQLLYTLPQAEAGFLVLQTLGGPVGFVPLEVEP